MQAIIRYELVINEALRSALMLDTPDEQIDEFIRFFGKHIGCDRIYIFEDNKKEHVTDNTYEWWGKKRGRCRNRNVTCGSHTGAPQRKAFCGK